MEKPFEIGSLDNRKKNAIVYSTNYFRMEEYIDDLAMSLKDKHFEGKVIFDLLLSNGSTFNRFIEMYFDGAKFDHKTIKVINNVDTHIINNSINFYSSHENLLENSILSKAQKFLIKKKRHLAIH